MYNKFSLVPKRTPREEEKRQTQDKDQWCSRISAITNFTPCMHLLKKKKEEEDEEFNVPAL